VLLLLAILMELMTTPLFAGGEQGLRVAQGLAIVVMVAALWAAGGRTASIVLFVPTILAHVLVTTWGSTPIHVTDLVLRAVFFGYTTGFILWSTLRRSEVTLDTIAGAACAYTLLAVVWANFYALLELFHPGSFNIPTSWLMGPGKDPSAGLIYFSFVTLTTVGYGDITPQWPGAAGIAMTEAIVGQLYLAITIARLVGLHASRRD